MLDSVEAPLFWVAPASANCVALHLPSPLIQWSIDWMLFPTLPNGHMPFPSSNPCPSSPSSLGPSLIPFSWGPCLINYLLTILSLLLSQLLPIYLGLRRLHP